MGMKLVMVDMKKAIAKCSHEDAPDEEEPQQLLPIQCNEQQLPPRRLQDGHNEDDDAAAARQGDGLHDRWDVSSLLSAGPTWPGAGLLRCSLSDRTVQLPTVFHASNN